jgi:hypothetical protein
MRIKRSASSSGARRGPRQTKRSLVSASPGSAPVRTAMNIRGPLSAIDAIISRFTRRRGDAAQLAASIEITPEAMSRGRRKGSFDVVTCLKIAAETGERPGNVLRAAGKHDVAALLDRLYSRNCLTGSDRRVLRVFDQLRPRQRTAVLEFVIATKQGQLSDTKLTG